MPHQREALIRKHGSFAVEDLVVDTELLESARDAGYATKVVFISTEDANLNVGRILIRMSRGGQSVPLSIIPESYQQSLKSLPEARKHADDVLEDNAFLSRVVEASFWSTIERQGLTSAGNEPSVQGSL